MSDTPAVSWIQSSKQRPLCDVPWMGTSVVHADGRVNFCCHSDVVVGNVNGQSFESIWNGEQMQRIRAALAAHQFPPECQTNSCPIYRNDAVSFIRDRMSGSDVTHIDDLENLRARMSNCELSMDKASLAEGERIELTATLRAQVGRALVDLFVGIKRPDESFFFLPDGASYAVPYAYGIAIDEQTVSVRVTGPDLSLPGTYEVCAALFGSDFNPNIITNCYWARTKSIVVQSRHKSI